MDLRESLSGGSRLELSQSVPVFSTYQVNNGINSHRLLARLLIRISLALVVTVHALLQLRLKSEPKLDTFLAFFQPTTADLLQTDGRSLAILVERDGRERDELRRSRLEIRRGKGDMGDR